MSYNRFISEYFDNELTHKSNRHVLTKVHFNLQINLPACYRWYVLHIGHMLNVLISERT